MATNNRTTSGTGRTGATRESTARRRSSTTRRRTTAARARNTTTTSTRPNTPVAQAQVIAERAVLVPVGATLLVRDNIVSSVREIATKYRTRSSFERELTRYERRGATARNRFERQVRRTRTKFERDLRQRRSRVQRSVKQNRRRLEREVRSVRRDLERQSNVFTTRAQRLVSDAQARLNVVS